MHANDELLDWLALSFVTGIGSRTASLLLDRFGSLSACFNASILTLERSGVKREAAEQLKGDEPRVRAEIEIKELEKIGGEALTLADERYPELLRETYDPPIVLYALGDFPRA